LFTNDLYERVLINPAKEGFDELFTVSGFASSTFANRHLKDLSNLVETTENSLFKVNLIIGMKINRNDDIALKQLLKKYPSTFDAFYFEGRGEVHSKVYCWAKNKKPMISFSGSANYSQEAFVGNQQNQMVEDNAEQSFEYFRHLLRDSSPVISTPIKFPKRKRPLEHTPVHEAQPGSVIWLVPDRSVKISLLTKQGGIVPNRSGLNWGQRPNAKREPNQAYLALYEDTKAEGFFPERGKTFTLITDDEKSFDMTVQQDSRKAISSTSNNSEIGVYFRKRIGVPLDMVVTRRDLEQYGRTDFQIEKLNEETFILDFSV
jgi:hypothetical protein